MRAARLLLALFCLSLRKMVPLIVWLLIDSEALTRGKLGQWTDEKTKPEQREGGLLVVPVKQLMRDLPFAVPLKQGEYVGSSGIGAGQLT